MDWLQKKDLREEKRILRKEVLRKRDALAEENRVRQEDSLFRVLSGASFFREAEAVLGFAGYGSEVNTDEILNEVIRQGKQLFLPKVEGDNLSFYRVERLDELAVGYKGIREPAGDGAPFSERLFGSGKILVLMPGVAFDAEGNRMGYGKGFYDRFLAAHPALIPHTVGIGYACQMVERVPCEEQDIRLGRVICAEQNPNKIKIQSEKKK